MRALAAIGAAALLGGCATTQGEIPIQQMTDSRATIRAAEEMGAERVDAAAEHLALAKQQTDRATQLLEQGEERRASFLFERATADAELAIALTKEAPVRAEAERLLQQVQAIQVQGGTQP